MFSKFLSTKGTPPACPIFHFQLFSPMKKILPLFIACLLWFVGGLQAQNVPQGINYQTIVRGSDGDPATNASFKFLFEIKDGIGSLLYSETQTKSTNDYGLVNMQVGQGTPGFSFFNLIDWSNGPRTMTVSIETAPNIYTPLGTMQLMSVPFALYSAESATAQTLDHLGAQTGQVLKWNGSAWAPANDATGTGTVTQINTGTGLAGGPITNTGTITLTNTGVTSGIYGSATKVPVLEVDPQGRISNIGEADINSGAVTLNEGAGIDIGVNGLNNYTIINSGDLNPNDDVLQSTPHDGDVVGLYNNLQLKAGVVGAAEIANDAVNGNHIAPMGASAGQVLKYDGANWAPAQDLVGTNGNNYSPGQGIQITGNAPDFTITNSGDLSAANEGLLTVQAGNATSAVIASNTAGSTGVTIAAGAGIGIGESPANNSITITNEGDTNPADDLTIASQAGGDVSGPFSNLQIAADAVTANEIANAAVNTGELADQSVTAAKLANMNAASGQVLKFNGTSWAPDTDLSGGGGNNYAAGNGIQITGSAPNFTINNTGDQNPNDDLTTASNAGGDVTGVFSNLQIATGAVTSNEIANATIVAADLAQMGATTGQVLRWNGSAWAPATLSGSGGILDCGDINSPQPEEAIAIGGVCQNNESQAYIRAIRSTSTVNGLDIRVVNEDTPDTDGANQRGILLNVQNGSNDNDGVIILSRANNGANGMKIAAQSNGDDATGLRIFAGETDIDNINEDGNGTAQNYGVYIDLQDRVNNNGSGAPDIGLYVNDNNPDFNWAIFADGDTRARDIYAADDAFIDDQLYTDDAIVNRNFYIRNTNGNVWRYSVLANGNLGFYYGNNGGQNQLGSFINTTGVYQVSDQSLKENIRPLSATLSKMMLLQPYQYNYTHDPLKKNTVGFLAQDVEKLFPEVVMNAENEDGSEVLTVNYAGFAVLAVKSVQEMQQTIEKQQTVISQQEARLLSLEKEMAELKALFKASNEDKK